MFGIISKQLLVHIEKRIWQLHKDHICEIYAELKICNIKRSNNYGYFVASLLHLGILQKYYCSAIL